MHPLTDSLPDYLDALALRQACGEIEAGLRGQIDCRTCRKSFRHGRDCLSVVRCIDGSRYERAAPIQLWRFQK